MRERRPGHIMYQGRDTILDLPVGRHSLYIPARALIPRVTTAPATLNSVEVATSLIPLTTMDFGNSADSFALWHMIFPKGWDGGVVNYKAYFSTDGSQTASLDGVAWSLRARSFADDDSLRAAFGTAVVVTKDHSGVADDEAITAESGDLTIAGTPVAGEEVWFELSRDVSDAADDLNIDARLHGIALFFNTIALTDD